MCHSKMATAGATCTESCSNFTENYGLSEIVYNVLTQCECKNKMDILNDMLDLPDDLISDSREILFEQLVAKYNKPVAKYNKQCREPSTVSVELTQTNELLFPRF